MVVTPKGTVRRNCLHLNVDPSATVDFPDTDSSKTPEIPDDEPRRIMTRSQTGTETHPPDRLYDLWGEMWQM